MTEAAQAPYKGPFSVKHHSDTEMADHYWIEDANGKAIRGVDLGGAQWLRDTLNAATRPATAPVGGDLAGQKLAVIAKLAVEPITGATIEAVARERAQRLYWIARYANGEIATAIRALAERDGV
jgi:hypothetical protein